MSVIFQAQITKLCQMTAKRSTLVFATVTHAGEEVEQLHELATPMTVLFKLQGANALNDLKQTYGDWNDGVPVKANDLLCFEADGILEWDGDFVINGTDIPVHHLQDFVRDSVSLLLTPPKPQPKLVPLVFRQPVADAATSLLTEEADEMAWV